MKKIERKIQNIFKEWLRDNSKYDNRFMVLTKRDEIDTYKNKSGTVKTFSYYLWNTAIFECSQVNEKVFTFTIKNDGWETKTTKSRLNLFLNLFDMSVFQKDFEWYIDYKGKVYDFYKFCNNPVFFNRETMEITNLNLKEQA